jgi:RimJ/RimL family protein N-acetyltransferase
MLKLTGHGRVWQGLLGGKNHLIVEMLRYKRTKGGNSVYKDMELIIRPILEEDLPALWELIYKEESPEWKKWDAPYFEHIRVSFSEYLTKKEDVVAKDNRWAIEVAGDIIGTVSYYWEHRPSYWLEIGIAIYDPKYWSGGYGTRALRLWI